MSNGTTLKATKFSELPLSPSNADTNTTLVGYPGTGNTDYRYSLSQLLGGGGGAFLSAVLDDQLLSGGWNVAAVRICSSVRKGTSL